MGRAPSVPHGQDEQWTKNGYDIILTRNMFSRDRRPVRDRGREERIVPNPESYFLLKGIVQEVQENNQFIAFVEDKNSGAVLRLHAGDRVARGQVKSLTLDTMEYQLQDKTTSVNIGYDLEGGHGAITASDLANLTPTATTGSTPAGSTAAPAAAPSADQEAVIKRLMEQRQQQMGR